MKLSPDAKSNQLTHSLEAKNSKVDYYVSSYSDETHRFNSYEVKGQLAHTWPTE